MPKDMSHGRGDDRFQRIDNYGLENGGRDRRQGDRKGGCPLFASMLISLPAAVVIGCVVLVKPLFRR